jgi:hypothetical protein
VGSSSSLWIIVIRQTLASSPTRSPRHFEPCCDDRPAEWERVELSATPYEADFYLALLSTLALYALLYSCIFGGARALGDGARGYVRGVLLVVALAATCEACSWWRRSELGFASALGGGARD